MIVLTKKLLENRKKPNMNLVQLVILVIIWIIVISLLIFLFFLIRKQKRQAINHTIEDLAKSNEIFKLKPIESSLKTVNNEINKIKPPIYFYSKTMYGSYQRNSQKIEKAEVDISASLDNPNLKICYYYPWTNWCTKKFQMFGIVELIISRSDLIIHHDYETITLKIAEITALTIIWEKFQNQKQSKNYRPILKIKTIKRNFLFLLENYGEIITFVLIINQLIAI